MGDNRALSARPLFLCLLADAAARAFTGNAWELYDETISGAIFRELGDEHATTGARAVRSAAVECAAWGSLTVGKTMASQLEAYTLERRLPTIISRPPTGELEFVHRTFVEYLVVDAYWRNETDHTVAWTDQMLDFLHDRIRVSINHNQHAAPPCAFRDDFRLILRQLLNRWPFDPKGTAGAALACGWAVSPSGGQVSTVLFTVSYLGLAHYPGVYAVQADQWFGVTRLAWSGAREIPLHPHVALEFEWPRGGLPTVAGYFGAIASIAADDFGAGARIGFPVATDVYCIVETSARDWRKDAAMVLSPPENRHISRVLPQGSDPDWYPGWL